MKDNGKLKHALHNENVCNYLELMPEFSDWIITTAFYSALHFVSYKIFPFEVRSIEGKKTKIETIDHYHSYTGRKATKHELLSDLVHDKCQDISADYDWLLSMSMNARYSNYLQDRAISNRARSLMKIIKKYCIAS
ncbi:MAG: hypothetical protein LBE82_03695 [Chitinophagaceae bacterium]|jgi:hypothetical protein|nr:hypothetical protein [Chitinophagaceae bacterium]